MRYLLFISLALLCGFAIGQSQISLESNTSTYVAGRSIELRYNVHQNADADRYSLVLDNGTARVQIDQTVKDGVLNFQIPEVISQKSGLVILRLYQEAALRHQSSLEIIADVDHAKKVESYCGPKHLVVDRNDYTMIVSTILDQFGNPLPKEESITAGYDVTNQLIEKPMKMRPLFGYQRLVAPKKKGYGNVTGRYGSLVGKSFRVDYYAIDPLDFAISYERQHRFADGEQLVVFKTEIIKDAADNVIGNGTIVKFLISSNDGRVAELHGQTLDGVATCVLYAPEKAEVWTVTAGIDNYADSRNTLKINFEVSVSDFDISYSQASKQLLIGPVTGYMGQWMKNGTIVNIEIIGGDSQLLLKKTLKDGQAILHEHLRRLAKGEYLLKATVAGITKTINITIDD
ncbi:MAG: hypothetical protein AAFQ94_03255 [Bacteroidota bacterium]